MAPSAAKFRVPHSFTLVRPSALPVALPLALLLALALSLGGCGRLDTVDAGRANIGGGLSVAAGNGWSRFRRPLGSLSKARSGTARRLDHLVVAADEAWTKDGLPLDHMLFLAGRRDGQGLLGAGGPLIGQSKRSAFEFRRNMTPTEIAELWQSELTRSGAQRPRIGRVAPIRFAGRPGFRFQYAYANSAGLLFDGLAAGTIAQDKLYLIAFAGTRAHQYAAHWPAAARVIRSARLKD